MINFLVVDDSSSVNELEGILQDSASVDMPYSLLAQPDAILVMRRKPDNAWFLLEAVSLDEWLCAMAKCTKMWVDIFGEHAGSSHARVYIRNRLDAVCESFPALRYTMGWLQYVMMGAMPSVVIDIAKYQKQGAQALLDKLWIGPESLIQRHLLQRHCADEVWPYSSFLTRACAVFAKNAPPNTLQALMSESKLVNGFFWGEADDHRFMVANLPVLLGLWSMTGTPMTWWHRQRRIDTVEHVRAFNPAWFDLAYQHGVQLAVVLGVQLEPIKEDLMS